MFQVISSAAHIILPSAGATPRHEHDCDCCRFTGTFDGAECGRKFDLYFCPTHGELVARFGSEGEYASMPLEDVRGFGGRIPHHAAGVAAYDAMPVARAIEMSLNKGSALKELI